MRADAVWFAGDELTFVWDGGILMLDRHVTESDAAAVKRIWSGLTAAITLSGVLQLLTDVLNASLLTLPDFAVALYDGDAGQFAARGRFEVEIGRADGPVQVVGAGVTTWSERAVGGIESLCVRISGAPSGVGLPLRAGVVTASRVTLGEADLARAATETHAASKPAEQSGALADLPGAESAATIAPADAAGAADPAERAEDENTPAGTGEPSAGVEPVVGPETLAVLPTRLGPPDVSGDEGGQFGTATLVQPADEPASPVEAPSHSRFAAMWGDTVAHSIEDAAVRLEEDAVAPAKPAPAPGPDALIQAPLETPKPPSGGPDGDVISLVPGRSGAPSLAPAAAAQEAWADHDGETIVGFSLGSPQPATVSVPVKAEQVLALVCGNGHPNRPHRTLCTECQMSLSGASTSLVPRPALGQIRATTGDVVALTGPVLIGRSPRAARFQGSVSPQLLSLPSPHISSTHLEVRLEGWNVFAVDLNSRNGAYLRRRDEPPVRITHSPLMLVDGDVIDFGHGVSVSFEGMP